MKKQLVKWRGLVWRPPIFILASFCAIWIALPQDAEPRKAAPEHKTVWQAHYRGLAEIANGGNEAQERRSFSPGKPILY